MKPVIPQNAILPVGTVVVPKPEYAHHFTPNARYVVTKEDIMSNGTIGDMWQVESIPPDSRLILKPACAVCFGTGKIGILHAERITYKKCTACDA